MLKYQNRSLDSVFRFKIRFELLITSMHCKNPANLTLLELIAIIIFGEEHNCLSSYECNLLQRPVTSPLTFNYSLIALLSNTINLGS